MERKYLDALLLLAGLEPVAIYEVANGYWGKREDAPPWWLVLTKAGPVVIGWRKRVISINWADTPVRALVTADETTKGEDHVHAWSYSKAVEYLSQIQHALNTAPAPQAA